MLNLYHELRWRLRLWALRRACRKRQEANLPIPPDQWLRS